MITVTSVFRVVHDDPEDEEELGSAFEAVQDAALAMCGICIFWPITLLFIATAFSISLRGRDVYGNKHALSTLIGFFLGVGGVIAALAGSFLFLIILGGEVGMPISIALPVIMIVVGLFLFIKDVGGKLFGAIGMGVTCLSQFGLMISLIMVFGADKAADWEPGLIISIIAIIFTLIGIILLAVGFIRSFIWMKNNKPLIDEEQEKSLQMQQQQLSIQHEQLSLQKQQLQLQMDQAGIIEDKPKAQIPSQMNSGTNQQPQAPVQQQPSPPSRVPPQ